MSGLDVVAFEVGVVVTCKFSVGEGIVVVCLVLENDVVGGLAVVRWDEQLLFLK